MRTGLLNVFYLELEAMPLLSELPGLRPIPIGMCVELRSLKGVI